jgi:hypothetical protein
VFDGLPDRTLVLDALGIGLVEGKIDRMPDLALRNAVERDAGDVGQQLFGDLGIVRMLRRHRLVDRALKGVVDRTEAGVHDGSSAMTCHQGADGRCRKQAGFGRPTPCFGR